MYVSLFLVGDKILPIENKYASVINVLFFAGNILKFGENL